MAAVTAPVTVGVPFYSGDEASHLRQAVESILNQTYSPTTVHLLQDGPVDVDLARVAEEFEEQSEIVEYHTFPVNRGLSYILNVSILRSNTPYYARMDADDISLPERFERQIEWLEAHPDIGILGTWAWEFTDEPREESAELKKVPTSQKEMESILHYRSPFIHPTVVFRRSVFSQIGLYPHRKLIEDLCLWSKTFKEGVRVANLPEPLLYFRFDGVLGRRASLSRILRETRMRFGYPTWSPKLNAMKIASLAFRFAPESVQEFAYRHFR